MEGIGASFIPEVFDRAVCDETLIVSDEEAFAMVKRLAVEEGVLGGSSSGVNVCGAIKIAKRLGKGKRVITLIPDSAERYLSKDIFNYQERGGAEFRRKFQSRGDDDDRRAKDFRRGRFTMARNPRH